MYHGGSAHGRVLPKVSAVRGGGAWPLEAGVVVKADILSFGVSRLATSALQHRASICLRVLTLSSHGAERGRGFGPCLAFI